jgi:hypothetical protein
MTTYSHSTDIPLSCRTNLEALCVWSCSVLYSLYPKQRYKEVGSQDPLRAIQMNGYRFDYENDKQFVIARMVIPMADDWEILSNKGWANAQPFPNSVTITGNTKYTID